ncbi:metal ABC transporter permease [uncultured Marinobacter sp.]|uniref:metal ABC transporter permease n=1 Tax=uncultured Marinobacter sp. TaxID=187379 RepID=UPI0030DCA3AC
MSEWGWLLAPVMASALMSVLLIPLGYRVLSRNMVFADLAVAQWAALGTLASLTLLPGTAILGLNLTSLGFALIAIALISLVMALTERYREALIGMLYVLGASLATLLVSGDPHGAQQLAQTLNGDLLWVGSAQLLPAGLLAVICLIWLRLPGPQQSWLFLPLFALAVTAAVDLAGIYVVFATLIVTPLLICHIAGRSLPTAMLACFGGHLGGLWLSADYDLPAGPAVVVSIVAVAMMLVSFSRLYSGLTRT